jgi:MFS family permease
MALWLAAIFGPVGGFLSDRFKRPYLILIASCLAFALLLVFAARSTVILPSFVAIAVICAVPAGIIMSLPARVLEPSSRAIGMGVFDPAQRNMKRPYRTLDWLESHAGPDGFWPSALSPHVVLACLILWSEARGKIELRGRPKLENIVGRLQSRPSFTSTTPRTWPRRSELIRQSSFSQSLT